MQEEHAADLLFQNIDKLHTTTLGIQRIKQNLNLDTDDVVKWCKQLVKQAEVTTRKGKNWYVESGECILTINAHSFTIITAHKKGGKLL